MLRRRRSRVLAIALTLLGCAASARGQQPAAPAPIPSAEQPAPPGVLSAGQQLQLLVVRTQSRAIDLRRELAAALQKQAESQRELADADLAALNPLAESLAREFVATLGGRPGIDAFDWNTGTVRRAAPPPTAAPSPPTVPETQKP